MRRKSHVSLPTHQTQFAHANGYVSYVTSNSLPCHSWYSSLHSQCCFAGRGHNTNPSEVRFLCEQELDPSSGFIDCFGQSGNRLSVLMDMLHLPATRQALSMTTNAQISAAYKAMSKNYCKTSGSETVLRNRMCGCCGHFEEEGDSMKRCSGCMTEFYCSPECQRAAWSDHQHICNPVP